MSSSSSQHAAFLNGAAYALAVSLYLYLLAWGYGQPFEAPYQLLQLIAGVLCFLLLRRHDLVAPWHPGQAGSTGTRVLIDWGWIVALLLFLGFFSRSAEDFSRVVLFTWFLTTPLLLLGLHWLAAAVARRMVPELAQGRSTVIVFANHSARALSEKLARASGYRLIGYFDDRDEERTGGGIPGVPLLGKAREVAQYVKDHSVQVVFVVLPDSGSRRALQSLDELGDTTASLYYVPDFFVFSMLKAKLGEFEGVPVLQLAETPFYGADGLLKRAFDIVFGIFALIALTPVLIGIAIAVKLSSPGPVLFKQVRYGLNGQRFEVYKFRSMVVNNEADTKQASRNDNRITRVGAIIRKTSLDELPQFWNVVKGEMSVVGPRPHPVALNESSRKEVKRYMLRHKVKPGVTGWAQVNGLRGETANIELMEERIRFDLEYIRNWSPLFDLKIIVRTVVLVFRDDMAF